ncbi:hypothetical protein [Streptomyces platensis]|uniref:hypothetical protein n=1 Tax=Streptomyces platensis TaxID=58346 RepID=UPI001F2E346B|nr:hypothetical protein [Streptomyces platensis]MCF3142704.1 hypothetical protein [Streptomyces platensis]
MPRALERTTLTVLAAQPAPDFRAVGLTGPDPRLLWGVPRPTETTGATRRHLLLNAKAPVR